RFPAVPSRRSADLEVCGSSWIRQRRKRLPDDLWLEDHAVSPPFGSLTKRARSLPPPHFNALKCSILHNLRHRFLVPPRPHADGGGVYRLFTGILRFSQAVRWFVCGPHQSSTTTASPPVLCSSRTATLTHCQFRGLS